MKSAGSNLRFPAFFAQTISGDLREKTAQIKKSGAGKMPAPDFLWLPELGSNQRPADYNACALDYIITLGMIR